MFYCLFCVCFSKLLLIIFSFNFCAKIIDIVFFVWTRFVMFLDGVCICLGCVYTLTGLGLFFLYFLLLNYFFHSITTPNLLLLCYCQKWQVPIFVGWTSFLVLLYHFYFCLGCVDILTGPALICDVFCCLFNFFLSKHYS